MRLVKKSARPRSTHNAGRIASDARQRLEQTAPRKPPGLSRLPRDHDALDGQRRLRSRQQRRVLQLVRLGRQRAPDPRGRARHPSRRSDRPRRRDPVQLLRTDRISPAGRSVYPRRANGTVERALRSRPFREGPGLHSSERTLRARLRRSGAPPARATPVPAQAGAGVAPLSRAIVSETVADPGSVDTAIETRFSCRAFLREKPVAREVIEHILGVERRAPSGTYTQP